MYVLLFGEAKQKSAETVWEGEIALGHLWLLMAQQKKQLKHAVTFTAVAIIIIVVGVVAHLSKSAQMITFQNIKQVILNLLQVFGKILLVNVCACSEVKKSETYGI